MLLFTIFYICSLSYVDAIHSTLIGSLISVGLLILLILFIYFMQYGVDATSQHLSLLDKYTLHDLRDILDMKLKYYFLVFATFGLGLLLIVLEISVKNTRYTVTSAITSICICIGVSKQEETEIKQWVIKWILSPDNFNIFAFDFTMDFNNENSYSCPHGLQIGLRTMFRS